MNENEESKFKHRLVFLTKDALNSNYNIPYTSIIYTSTSAFRYFEKCMESDDQDQYASLTMELFYTFNNSYPMISKNILFCIAYAFKWQKSSCVFSDHTMFLFKEMGHFGLFSTDKVVRYASSLIMEKMSDRTSLSLLAKAMTDESDTTIKGSMKGSIQVVIFNVQKKEKAPVLIEKPEESKNDQMATVS